MYVLFASMIRSLHLVGIAIRSDLLSSHTSNYIDITTVVLHALLRTSTRLLLLVLLLVNLWGLTLHFSCAG